MKMCIKKIYCDSCQKLVKCREQEAGGGTQVLCFKCGRTLRLLEGATWKYIGRLPEKKVQPEPKPAKQEVKFKASNKKSQRPNPKPNPPPIVVPPLNLEPQSK